MPQALVYMSMGVNFVQDRATSRPNAADIRQMKVNDIEITLDQQSSETERAAEVAVVTGA